MSATTCPIFRPTTEQFSSFSRYVEDYIEPNIKEHGICKVVPPADWSKMPTPKQWQERWSRSKLLIPPLKQCISGLRGCYQLGLMDTKKMTVQEFQERAEKHQPVNFDKLSHEERERLFWRSMGPLAPPPMYGADMTGTMFGDDHASGWNLNKLDNMIKLLPSNLPGVATSMLYFGMWRAMFAWHTEDMNLYSINYLHVGRPKSWYSIPPASAKRFESMVQSFCPQGFQECSQFMRHKTSMISPKVLKDYGIDFDMIVQQPGEFVITFPASYHAGYNHGFNVAEATNFTTEKWIAKGREAKVCLCQPFSVRIDMNHFVNMLALKRQDDQVKLESLNLNSEQEKAQHRKRLENTGWLEWQAEIERAQAEDRSEQERLRVQAKRKAAEESEMVNGKRKMTDRESGGRVGVLGEEDWEFRCYCGMRCTSDDGHAILSGSAVFQCTGCNVYCHSQCLYNRDKPPSPAFCHICHERLRAISQSPQPIRAGSEIRLKSRVVVCRALRGLEEGNVMAMADGMVRVMFRARDRGHVAHEEYIPLDSNRFLSPAQIAKALGTIDTTEGQERARAVAIKSRERAKEFGRASPQKGVPLPHSDSAVQHARFMKDLHRNKKAFIHVLGPSHRHTPGSEDKADVSRRGMMKSPIGTSGWAGWTDGWTSDEDWQDEEAYSVRSNASNGVGEGVRCQTTADGRGSGRRVMSAPDLESEHQERERRVKEAELRESQIRQEVAERQAKEQRDREIWARTQWIAWEQHRSLVESMGLSCHVDSQGWAPALRTGFAPVSPASTYASPIIPQQPFVPRPVNVSGVAGGMAGVATGMAMIGRPPPTRTAASIPQPVAAAPTAHYGPLYPYPFWQPRASILPRTALPTPRPTLPAVKIEFMADSSDDEDTSVGSSLPTPSLSATSSSDLTVTDSLRPSSTSARNPEVIMIE